MEKKRGIIERENYNKPKSEDAKQPQCPENKEKAIREAFPRKWEKGWQDKLRSKEVILPQIMKIHREEKNHPGLTNKEIKRGCRLMSNYAEKY